MDAIQQAKKSHSQHDECELDEWVAALRFCDINFSARQHEYVQLVLYRQNGQFGRLNYARFLAHVFGERGGGDEWQQTEQSPRQESHPK